MIEIIKGLLVNLVVLSHIALVLGVISVTTGLMKNEITSFLRRNGFVCAFIVSIVAMLGSLFYSEIVGYEPCKLCWYQRILMYPQVLLLGFAIYRKEKKIYPYSMLMVCIGAFIAFYHYLLQLGIAPSVGCNAIGYSVDCSKLFILSYGYLTIPLMALTAFVLVGISLWYTKGE